MKMTPQEAAIVTRIARIVRAARKQLGLSQETIASRLGLIQSALSRIETGHQMLSAVQWSEFCSLTGISPDSILTGYVDFKKPVTLNSNDREGTFRIPKRFARDRGSKVRAMLPFLNYFTELYGEEALNDYLISLKLDPDFFIGLDNQVSINFCLEIAEQLVKRGGLKPKDFPRLTKSVALPETHGSLHYKYEGKTDPAELISSIVSNAQFYECNFQYRVEAQARRHLDLSITPNPHMAATKYRHNDVLGDFLCQYKKSYFESFATYGGEKETTKIDELECHFKGAHRCVYRVNLAS